MVYPSEWSIDEHRKLLRIFWGPAQWRRPTKERAFENACLTVSTKIPSREVEETEEEDCKTVTSS